MKYLIDLPLTIPVSNKNFSLNLNIYRNAHYLVLNQAKKNYGLLFQQIMKKLPKNQSNIILTYTLYPKTKREIDVSNVCCIVDKFFCDILVQNQVIIDDNYKHLKEIKYQFGEIDKKNPRCEVLIDFLDLK